MNTSTRDALDFLGFKMESLGGNCSAWRMSVDDTRCLRIQYADDPIAPPALSVGPVAVTLGDDSADVVESRDVFPTLAHALLDIYGPAEGEDLPAPLAECEEIAAAFDADDLCEDCGETGTVTHRPNLCNTCAHARSTDARYNA